MKKMQTIKDVLASGYRLNSISENRIRQEGEWELYADDGQKLAVPFKADFQFGSPRVRN